MTGGDRAGNEFGEGNKQLMDEEDDNRSQGSIMDGKYLSPSHLAGDIGLTLLNK